MPTQGEIDAAFAVLRSAYTEAQAVVALGADYAANGDIPASGSYPSLTSAEVQSFIETAIDYDVEPDKYSMEVIGSAAQFEYLAGAALSPVDMDEFLWACVWFWRAWATRQPAIRASIWG